MPRLKNARRSEASKKMWIDRKVDDFFHVESRAFVPPRGTGRRHAVKQWPISPFTGKSHKLILPAESPDKKVVLVIGASHLRAIADGFVTIPEGRLSFGIMSTPGAAASELRTELLNADIPITPDIVCLMAPSNNITATPSIDVAGDHFNRLLRTVCDRFPKVFVLDFVPRINTEQAPQEFLRQRFHQVATKHGVKYCHIAEHFPLDSHGLWSRDGIHLSDNLGMPVLVQLLWNFSNQQLEADTPPPVTPPLAVPPRSPLPVRSFTTRVVVKGEVARPPLDPFKETVVGRRGKRSQPEDWELPQDWDTPDRRFLPQEVWSPPVVLKECSVVLNPVLFSTEKLAAVELKFPSDLDSLVYSAVGDSSGKKRKVAPRRTPALSKVRRAKSEKTSATPRVVPPPSCAIHSVITVEPTSEDELSLSDEEWPTLHREVVPPRRVPLTRNNKLAAMGDVVPSDLGSPVISDVWSGSAKKRKVAHETPVVSEKWRVTPEALKIPATEKPSKLVPPPRHVQAAVPTFLESSVFMHTSKLNRPQGDDQCLSDKWPVLQMEEPCDVVPAIPLTTGHVSFDNPGCTKGSFDQSDDRFGENAGKQCATNSIAAIMTNVTKSVFKWKKKQVNQVLKQGDGLYTTMIGENTISAANTTGYIFNDELPRQCVLNRKQFSLEYSNSFTGDLDVEDYDATLKDIAMPLDVAVQMALLEADTFLLNVKQNVCAVFKEDSAYAVFDPHSRSTWGSVAPDGTSIVARYDTLVELYNHIKNLVNSLYADDPNAPNKSFEVTAVKAVQVNASLSASDPDSDSDVSLPSVTDDTILTVNTNVPRVTEEPIAITSTRDATVDTDSDSDVCLISITDQTNLAVNASIAPVTVEPVADTSTCDTNVNTDDSDVCLLSVTDSPNITFKGLTLGEKNRICTKLNIVPSLDKNIVVQSFVMEQPQPCKTTPIEGDGNCFFRSLSSIFSGIENNHKAFRKAVVKQIENNQRIYSTCLRQEFLSVEQYLRDSKMKYVGSWATELEIQASADFLSVDIYTYSQNKWIKFTANIEQNIRKAIYLKHCNECHYEPIACVKEINSITCVSLTTFSQMHHAMSKSDVISPRKYTVKVKGQHKKRYAEDTEFRQAKVLKSIQKYATDSEFQDKVNASSAQKYVSDKQVRDKKKASSIQKYASDEPFKDQVKASSIQKYASDEPFKDKVKASSVQKYADNPDHRARVLDYNVSKRSDITLQKQNIDFVIEQFQEKVKHGPEYVCCVCHRLLFENQVIQCPKSRYSDKSADVATVADKCITFKYLHECDDTCDTQCTLKHSIAGKLWICHNCDGKIRKAKVPQESVANNMGLDPIPEELRKLNSLEQHLVARNIPFMRLLPLPKGAQHGVSGAVTCVPSNFESVTSVLPRLESQDLMIPIKLKRKLTYKGHYEYQYVKTQNIHQALENLISNNKWYEDVHINTLWKNPLEKDKSIPGVSNIATDTIKSDHIKEIATTKDNADEVKDGDVDDHMYVGQQYGVHLDTCLQPIDIAQEILDQHFDSVLSVAPAQGNSPIRLLTDTSNEAKCFPVLFPKGTGTFHEDRPHKLTLARYLNTRILNADGRFSSNLDYIFYAQYLSEVHQVVSNVSIALRKGHQGGENIKITSADLSNQDFVKNLLKCDMGYKFLKPIRGTPVFWAACQKNLMATVRQLGVPTWFCSFSSADLRWTELMEVFVKSQNIKANVKDLDWSQKCSLLKSNPVTAARMFDRRFRCFLKEVLMSPANPIGKIVDYFYRVEFQQRGSPHTHCLFWVENAPKIGKNTDQEVIDFVDKYVTCSLPPETDPMFEVVSSVQKHSSKHTKSCKKRGTLCRFNFPRPPSNKTFICKTKTGQKHEETKEEKTKAEADKRKAKAVLERVKEALSNTELTFDTVDQLFDHLGINQQTFETAYRLTTNKNSVVLKRKASDVYINQYNKDLLRCWNANLDIQFVCDAFACVVYIISYISKAEREMGLLLRHTQNEINTHGNIEAKQALNKLGSVFLHNREISAQESVYRVTNMRLQEGSRKVTFIPTGDNITRMSLPLNLIQKKSQQGDTSQNEIWMSNIIDKYQNRPKCAEFHDICIATFASKYRDLYGIEKYNSGAIKLNNNSGFVKARTRTDVAVVRYARFSEIKNSEKHYQSLMQLFLPHYSPDQLKPNQYNSFEEFYRTGSITNIDNDTLSVKEVVDLNRSQFEFQAEELDRCREVVEQIGTQEDAWADLCPETELERDESLHEIAAANQPSANEREDIPDLQSDPASKVSIEFAALRIPRSQALNIMRTLNDQQVQIFYKVRQWCLDKVNGKNPDPFRVFISGGAGTGKSHLIKAVYYESCRLLARMSSNPDDTHVLLTAPTGVAAYNINASTIHNSFAIGINVSLPYQPLREEKINTLRAKLKDLHILIIDEVSMVDHKILTYVHGRLRQIKQCGDFSAFGNVSIIAVGDFYQLPPVKGTPLYKEQAVTDLWDNNFKYIELTEIMRQKDRAFAETLNRIRTHKRGEKLNVQDEALIKQRETGTGEFTEDLHIFATNSAVDIHNVNMLHKIGSDIVEIQAQDYQKNPHTGQLTKTSARSLDKASYLSRLLCVGPKARVMLIKNIDVSDGLVNGVFGTVCKITLDGNGSFPKNIYVKFDDDKIGRQARVKCPCSVPELKNATPIFAEEDKVQNGGVRRQFPLRLAWACTIHKVQGLTLDKAVVSFKKIFSAGQAYVALSRVTSLENLIISDFKATAIYSRDDIKDSIEKMETFIQAPLAQTGLTLKVCIHNIQGLNEHIEDLKHDNRVLDADIIGLTETWLQHDTPVKNIAMPGWTFHHKVRSNSYSNMEVFHNLATGQHGGVGFYHKDHIICDVLDVPCLDLEAIIFNVQPTNYNVIVVYRPPSYNIGLFKNNLATVVNQLNKLSGGKIIMGDFNDNALVSKSVENFMQQHGYIQIVTSPTTDNATLIDHVYIKDINPDHVKLNILSTYYSYHECISLTFQLGS